MTKPRLHIPKERWTLCLDLSSSEKHRLVDVLRQKPGSIIEIFDGVETISQAVLQKKENNWYLFLGPALKQPDSNPGICLAVALLKGKKFDRVVRQATEVGIGVIQPFSSYRSVSRPDNNGVKTKEFRWKAVAAEAARQSQRTSIPVIKPCKSLEEILGQISFEERLILHEGVTEPTLINWLTTQPTYRDMMMLVGPEGGFTPEEIEKACAAGFVQVALGLPVLRAETAAVVAAAFACCQIRPK